MRQFRRSGFGLRPPEDERPIGLYDRILHGFLGLMLGAILAIPVSPLFGGPDEMAIVVIIGSAGCAVAGVIWGDRAIGAMNILRGKDPTDGF